jgi:hypothetical protein
MCRICRIIATFKHIYLALKRTAEVPCVHGTSALGVAGAYAYRRTDLPPRFPPRATPVRHHRMLNRAHPTPGVERTRATPDSERAARRHRTRKEVAHSEPTGVCSVAFVPPTGSLTGHLFAHLVKGM